MRIILGLAFITACTGDIGGVNGDDDMPPPPPPSDVQITVHDGAAPQANVRVLFQSSDGATLAEKTTDATGVARLEMPSGGNLTVIRTYLPSGVDPAHAPELYTYVGVKNGDRLVLGHELDTVDVPSAINVKVPEGAQGTVKVVTNCGSGTGTAPYVPITVAGCGSDIVFYVTDGNQSSFVAHAPYSETVDLSLQSLVGTLATTLSATNVLPDMTTVTAETRVVNGAFQLYSSGAKRVDTTPAAVNMPNLQSIDELVVATIKGTTGTQMVASRKPYAVTPTIVDASAGLLPYVSAAMYTPTMVTWMEQGTGDADFVIVTLDVTRSGGVDTYSRAIIAPHAGTSLAIPQLVGADAIYNPAMTDQIAGTQGLVKAPGGYDAARATAFSVSNVIQTAPMSGSVTLSYAGANPPTL